MKNEIEEEIKNLELSLLTVKVRSSTSQLDKLLSDDFIEYGSSGQIFDKNKTLKMLPVSSVGASYEARKMTAHLLSQDIAQVRFESVHMTGDGKQVQALRSSLWRKTEMGWQMFFHQGTKIE